MEFLVTLVQLSFLLRVIWQNVEGLAKKPTSGTLDTIWEVTGTKLPVLPVPPGHPVSKQNADGEVRFHTVNVGRSSRVKIQWRVCGLLCKQSSLRQGKQHGCGVKSEVASV